MATVRFERNIQKGTFTTQRNDKWWLLPLLEDLVIFAFIIYTVVVMLFYTDGLKYDAMGYVSPIYGVGPWIMDGLTKFINWPASISPAWILIWVPLGFRATCYYERKLYYRGFFANPPACTVNGTDIRRGKYTGERALPFILNNFHRYFFYATFVVMVLQTVDALIALTYGIGVGTILMLLTAGFLSLYVYSCHAFRHAIGGKTDCYDCGIKGNLQYKGWKIISKINERHGTWFWCSLALVMTVDFYIHLVVMNPSIDLVFLKF